MKHSNKNLVRATVAQLPETDKRQYEVSLKSSAVKTDSQNPEILFSRGVAFATGIGAIQSYKRAKLWFERAAKLGHPEAQFNLGILHWLGQGVEPDMREALFWFEKAAQAGLAKAQNSLAYMLSIIGNTIQDSGYHSSEQEASKYFRASEEWYRKAAEQCYAPAQFNLGQIYLHGDGVPQDHVKGAGWIEQAARLGHHKAMDLLARLYAEGRGVPLNEKEAGIWFCKVAEHCDPEQQTRIALRFYHGNGVLKNHKLAEQLLNKASKRGSARAAYNLAMLKLGDLKSFDCKQEKALLRQAAARGHRKAKSYLAWMDENGDKFRPVRRDDTAFSIEN